jgi:putative ABC transport system substrate-binding protein
MLSSSGGNAMSKRIIVPFFAILFLASVHLAQAQPAKVYRVGLILEGGPFYAVIDGLKDGLRDLGFEEGKHFLLEIRDLKGDRKAAEGAARSLERERVNLIYVIATSVATVVKRATTEVPIVFAGGDDPVATGLVESFSKPGGRLTGVHYLVGDLTAKRRDSEGYPPRTASSRNVLRSQQCERHGGREVSAGGSAAAED